MKPVIAIIAPGSMGAGVGRRLVECGAAVRTALDGRSPASIARAHAAGMEAVGDDGIVAADFVLSIVPPAEAIPVAERLAPLLVEAARKPVYVDCNAVSPATVTGIADLIAETGCPFIDVGIIGAPPQPGGPGPVFYASGPEAPRLEALSRHGLEIAVLDGPVGAASTLKLSYAGITKGLTALGAAMALAATRAGAAAGLRHELARSQPALLAWLTRQVPAMYPKAYRWVAEMEEIAEFVAEDGAASLFFEGAARLYDRLAEDLADGGEIGALTAFFAPPR
jgi:L-threonate 2-dehydrogenase